MIMIDIHIMSHKNSYDYVIYFYDQPAVFDHFFEAQMMCRALLLAVGLSTSLAAKLAAAPNIQQERLVVGCWPVLCNVSTSIYHPDHPVIKRGI